MESVYISHWILGLVRNQVWTSVVPSMQSQKVRARAEQTLDVLGVLSKFVVGAPNGLLLALKFNGVKRSKLGNVSFKHALPFKFHVSAENMSFSLPVPCVNVGLGTQADVGWENGLTEKACVSHGSQIFTCFIKKQFVFHYFGSRGPLP